MPGALALPFLCLRCQFHAAICQTRILRSLPSRCKAFSTHRPRFQQQEQWLRGEKDEEYTWRSIAMIDEERGRRKKPFIILEDKLHRKDKSRNRQGLFNTEGRIDKEKANDSPSAKQIESVVNESNTVPAQKDVDASLEAMRIEATRESTVMDSSKFDSLLQDLVKSYTIHQLGRYMDRLFQKSSHKVRQLHLSPWRPGRTPLTQRPGKNIKRNRSSPKRRIANRILRLVWEITVESEENENGELEVELKPWQLSLLFDVNRNGTRYLDGLLTPQTLIQSSEIQAYRPDNIMRITGRRQTAEEIDRQLKFALLDVHHLRWDLKPLIPSLRNSDGATVQLFREQDISYVAQLTESVIVSEDDGVVAIYCTSQFGMLNARRLLLALLDQSHASLDGIARPIDADATSESLIGTSEAGIQRRYHGLELFRTAKPLVVLNASTNNDPTREQASVNEAATSLAQQLDAINSPRGNLTAIECSDSYWRRQAPSVSPTWKAKFCSLVHTESKDRMPASSLGSLTQPRNIVQQVVPGLEALLSYFEVSKSPETATAAEKDFDERHMLPFVKVHLIPSSKGLGSGAVLPRLEMRFHFSESRSEIGLRELGLTGLQAVVDEQRLSVPLPGYATDLQFIRRSTLSARVDSANADSNILHFVQQLQESARNKGALTAPAELLIKLPSWLVKNKPSEDSVPSQDVPIKYLFERFEHIQRMLFVPRRDGALYQKDDHCRNMLRDLPEHLHLDCREVESGAIYGNSTILLLGVGRHHRTGNSWTTDELQPEQTTAKAPRSFSSEIAGAALRVAHLLTRASSGDLKRCGEE